MNRQRFLTRDRNGEGGTAESQQLGLALAAQCDPELLEALIHGISALDEFGGQLYIAAARDRLDNGEFTTWGYIFHYGSKATIRRLESEEEVTAEAPPPEPDAEQPFNGEVDAETEMLDPVES